MNQAMALIFTGFLDVPTEGKYTFYVKSNEMYKMYFGPIKLNFRDLDIEEKPEQESTVKEQKADIDLQAGKHQFTFLYFKQTYQAEKQVDYSLELPQTGEYAFYLKSESGQEISLGHFEEAEEEGSNEMKFIPDKFALKKAPLDLTLQMHQEEVLPSLEIMYKGPRIDKEELSQSMMFHISEQQ